MIAGGALAAAAAAAAVAADGQVADVVARVAARAVADLPEAAVATDGETVRLTGRGLLRLAFGDRGSDADPRLAALTQRSSR